MSQLINERRETVVITFGEHKLKQESFVPTAEFYFRLALAHNLEGNSKKSQEYWDRARQCEDYTQVMERDFHRDRALHLIRIYAPEEQVRSELRITRELHFGDLNRRAALMMTRARMNSMLGFHRRAFKLHRDADDLWKVLEENGEYFNEQWVRNNRFHHMLAAARLKKMRFWAKYYARDILHDAEELDPDRKKLARLIEKFPLLGVRVYDWKIHQPVSQ